MIIQFNRGDIVRIKENVERSPSCFHPKGVNGVIIRYKEYVNEGIIHYFVKFDNGVENHFLFEHLYLIKKFVEPKVVDFEKEYLKYKEDNQKLTFEVEELKQQNIILKNYINILESRLDGSLMDS